MTFCPDLLRSTFAAEKLLLLCRILPRPVIPEMVVPIKSPVPFLQKAYILLLLFYHNWPQATTSLLLSCEKVNAKALSHRRPTGAGSMKVLLRPAGGCLYYLPNSFIKYAPLVPFFLKSFAEFQQTSSKYNPFLFLLSTSFQTKEYYNKA